MLKIIALVGAFLCAPVLAEEKEQMDLILVLAVDVSASIGTGYGKPGLEAGVDEYQLQKNGIAKALRDLDVAGVLEQCNTRGVAITYVEWSGASERNRTMARQVLQWKVLRSKSDLQAFAREVEQISQRSYEEDTDIASALRFSADLIDQAPFEATRKIISLSSDGVQNVEPGMRNENLIYSQENRIAFVRSMRDETLAKNIVIDALVIMNDPDSHSAKHPLDQYYRENVTGGAGSFVHGVQNFQEFATGLKSNLMRELFSCMM